MKTIPLTPDQNSSFDVDVDNKRYSIVLKFNSRSSVWIASLSLGGTLLLSGVPLVAGVELFQGHALGTEPSNLFMIPVADPAVDATFSTLGVDVKFVIIEEGDGIDVSAIQ